MMRSTVYPFPNSSKDTMSPRDWRPMERWRGDRTGSAKIQGPQNQSCIDHKPFTHPRSFNSYSEFSPEKMGDWKTTIRLPIGLSGNFSGAFVVKLCFFSIFFYEFFVQTCCFGMFWDPKGGSLKQVVTMRSAASPSERGSNVRAMLHADGTGSVSLAERYQAFNNETGAAEVRQIDEFCCFQKSVVFQLSPFFLGTSRFLTSTLKDFSGWVGLVVGSVYVSKSS